MTSLDRKYTYDRNELVSGELHKYVVMERCNVAYAAAYPNTKIYKDVKKVRYIDRQSDR